MYEYCEIQNKRSWSIRIETVVRALHFERCNPDNVHENASAFQRQGVAKLELILRQ